MKRVLIALLVTVLLVPLAGFSSGSVEMFSSQATIEETVLVDESDVKITATGLSYTDYSAELSLLIENNTDLDLSFYSGTAGYSCNAVNGYMSDEGYMNVDVSAGKKATEDISFDASSLAIMRCFLLRMGAA